MKRKSNRRLTRKRPTRVASRRSKKLRSFSRRRYRGGGELAVPEGSVVGVDLDPKDDYSVPVLVSKTKYEEEVLED